VHGSLHVSIGGPWQYLSMSLAMPFPPPVVVVVQVSMVITIQVLFRCSVDTFQLAVGLQRAQYDSSQLSPTVVSWAGHVLGPVIDVDLAALEVQGGTADNSCPIW
jgi:hypothetical protein